MAKLHYLFHVLLTIQELCYINMYFKRLYELKKKNVYLEQLLLLMPHFD